MSRAWTSDVSVRYSVSGGTAVSGTDYASLASGTLTFDSSQGEVLKTVRVAVTGDDVFETDEIVVVTLDSLTGGAVFTDHATSITGEGTISNDDLPPLLKITSPMVNEGNSGDSAVLRFVVTKTGDSDLPVTVGYAITGTASASGSGADFMHTVESPIDIPADQTSAAIDIDVSEDNLVEPDETVIVTLSDHGNHRFEQDASTIEGRGTIANDDFLTLSINSPSVAEGGTGDMPTLTFDVTLGAVSAAAVTVDYAIDGVSTATAGSDFAAFSAGTLVIAAGQTTGSIAVMVIGDADSEPSETVVMRLSNAAGGAVSEPDPTIEVAVGTGTIVADDGPLISIDSPSVSEGDSGSTDLIFTISMIPASDEAVSVDYSVAVESTATSGKDFQQLPSGTGTLTFVANQTSPRTVTVKVIGDREPEPNETVVLMLSGVTGDGRIGVDKGTGTIENDDFGLVISGPAPPVVTEPDGAATVDLEFEVTLTPASMDAVTVGYSFGGTAVEGADFTDASLDATDGKLTFVRGDTSKTIRAQVNSDFVDEDVETVSVEISGATGATIALGMDSAEGRIQPAAAASSAAVLSAGTPRFTKSEGSSPPAVGFGLSLSRGQSGVAEAVSVAWVIQEATRTTAGSVVKTSTLVRGFTGRNVMTRELATGSATVPAGASVFEVEGNLNTGITLESISGSQLVLELGRPSVPGVLIEQLDRVPADLQAEAHSNSRVAAVVFTTSSKGQSKVLSHVLSGIGRSAASSLVSVVWDRIASRRSDSAATRVRLGGRGLDAEALASGDARGVAREVAGLVGIEAVSPDASRADGPVSGNLEDFRNWAGLQEGQRFAGNTEIVLPLGESGSGGFAVWGKGDLSSFEAEVEGEAEVDPVFSYDGQSFSWHLGFDMPLGDSTIFGVALASSQGEVDHSFSDDAQSAGSVETSITSVAPWLHWYTSGGNNFWAAISIGSGTAEILEDSAESVERDIDLNVVALGMRGFSWDVGHRQMAVKADIFTADAEAPATEQVEAASGSSGRLRVAAESVSDRRLRSGGTVSTRLEGGGRYDGGDDDSGFGADTLISVEFLSSSGRFSAAGNGGLVLFHTKGGYSETRFGGMLAYRRSASGKGLQFSLTPEWNATAARPTDRLWDTSSAGARIAADQSARMKTRLGWGASALQGRVLAALYGEMEKADDGRSLRIGSELTPTDMAFGRFRLGVYGEQETGRSSGQDRSILLEGRLGL